MLICDEYGHVYGPLGVSRIMCPRCGSVVEIGPKPAPSVNRKRRKASDKDASLSFEDRVPSWFEAPTSSEADNLEAELARQMETMGLEFPLPQARTVPVDYPEDDSLGTNLGL